ncbi:unnamed protein product [Rotaria magnacalcarata]|nr:unnamed protein product [Rotaria magnacalcarata]CAF2078008.1 unnamed protein product [Rotaria magnacalcarata]CAF3850897.1 unnamed protein product [Rotaria magnacalcarata]CAF4197428.1 unnamed protein product [Rotaria magnacalcarata]
MASCDAHRVVFISASYLVHEYESIPNDVLVTALFFFGSKRSWIFPVTDDDKAESRMQPTRYLTFPDVFKELILSKEARNEVFWLKPECSYEQVSIWLQSLGYKGLQLEDTYWLTQRHGNEVVNNYTTGEHDYQAVIELVNQSNSGRLIAVLQYADSLLKKN